MRFRALPSPGFSRWFRAQLRKDAPLNGALQFGEPGVVITFEENASELAAWTMLTNELMNLDEVLTK